MTTAVRFYDPTTGQFLSRDPAVSVTREAYGYVYGNPLNASDPSGLFSVDLPGGWCFGNDDDCENPNNGHATAVSQPIVNVAGGALSVNPITAFLPLDLEGHGVDTCSNWYTGGQVAMLAVDLAFAVEGGVSGYRAATSRGALVGDAGMVGRFSGDQEALVELAKRARQTGVSIEDAETLVSWADELGFSSHGPQLHPGRPGWGGQNVHINVGPVRHVPVR